jgi:hypothetical protein
MKAREEIKKRAAHRVVDLSVVFRRRNVNTTDSHTVTCETLFLDDNALGRTREKHRIINPTR